MNRNLKNNLIKKIHANRTRLDLTNHGGGGALECPPPSLPRWGSVSACLVVAQQVTKTGLFWASGALAGWPTSPQGVEPLSLEFASLRTAPTLGGDGDGSSPAGVGTPSTRTPPARRTRVRARQWPAPEAARQESQPSVGLKSCPTEARGLVVAQRSKPGKRCRWVWTTFDQVSVVQETTQIF